MALVAATDGLADGGVACFTGSLDTPEDGAGILLLMLLVVAGFAPTPAPLGLGERELGLGGTTGRPGLLPLALAGDVMSFGSLTLSSVSELEFLYNSLEFRGELRLAEEFLQEAEGVLRTPDDDDDLLALFRSWTHLSRSSWLTLIGMRDPPEDRGSPVNSREFRGLGLLSLLLLLLLAVVLPGGGVLSASFGAPEALLTGRPDLAACC